MHSFSYCEARNTLSNHRLYKHARHIQPKNLNLIFTLVFCVSDLLYFFSLYESSNMLQVKAKLWNQHFSHTHGPDRLIGDGTFNIYIPFFCFFALTGVGF